MADHNSSRTGTILSYVVALVAFLIFVYNPIRILFSSHSAPHRVERLHLDESLIALESANDTLRCPPNAYTTRIFSREPPVLYMEGFLSPEERAHLLEISNPLFEPSTTTNDGSTTHHDPSVRLSDVALVPRTPTVRCIEARARALQGWRRDLWIERLRTQRYVAGGHYARHFDWSPGGARWGRVSSFMVWVAAEGNGSREGHETQLEGGGTEFPYLKRASDDARWCPYVECPPAASVEETPEAGRKQASRDGQAVVFKPIAGNALFWENFRADGSGRGYDETFHAGLPVTEGVKVGLNIWSWGSIE